MLWIEHHPWSELQLHIFLAENSRPLLLSPKVFQCAFSLLRHSPERHVLTMCLPPYVTIEYRGKTTKTNLRPLSKISTSPVVYSTSEPPRIISAAPSHLRSPMPTGYDFGVCMTPRVSSNNYTSDGERIVESRPQPNPPPSPPPHPPPPPSSPVMLPIRAPSGHHRSSSANSGSARSLREVKRKVSRIWMRVSKLEKDKERRKLEKEYERRRWEDQVEQRLLDGRWRSRDAMTRGRVRYIHPYEM